MKNRGIVIGIAVLVVSAFVAVSGCKGPKVDKPTAKDVKPAAQAAEAKKEPAKKIFAKDMGGLTVKIADAKGNPKAARIRAFRMTGSNSSVFSSTFAANKMQELVPGNYDIEVDTLPATIYKNISVAKEKETVQDLGAPMGALNIKALSVAKKDSRYPVRIYYPKTTAMIASGYTNKPIDILAGSYDIEIITAPLQSKKDIKIESGKETLIDIGMTTGSILVKAVDEKGAPARVQVRVKGTGKGEFVASGMTGRPIEVLAGTYDLDILSRPTQSKKGVAVKIGEETAADVTVQTPPKPAPAPARSKPAKHASVPAPVKPEVTAVKPAPAPAAAPAPIEKKP